MRSRVLSTLALVGALGAATPACGPRHVQPFTPRQRNYEPGAYAQKDPQRAPGSLFSETYPGFLEDTRAVRVGDLVVIRIQEASDAEGNSSTNLKHETNGSAGAGAMLGIVPVLKRTYPNMDPEKLFEFMSKAGFVGEGSTSRKGQLTGNIAVKVVRELPNGDLFLEGTKVVLINNEEYHLYVSGLVRPTDIGPDNSVPSIRLADGQIEFTGRGDIAEQNRKGWLARIIETFNPF